MSKIVIDAREYTTTSGRYVLKLLEYLQQTKSEHEYVVLLKTSDFERAHFTNPRFTKVVCDVKEFTFGEQTKLLSLIKSLKPDLVHFPMVQQPILYRGRVVTTMQDLTTVRYRNPSKNPIVFTIKQQIYKLVNQVVARKSKLLITPTAFVKQDVAAYTHVPPDKITVTLEAADRISDQPEVVPGLKAQQFIMYVGRPLPHKNLGRLIQAFGLLKQKYPELKLVLAGKKDALYEAHAAEAAKQGITDITFTGFVSEGQLRWLYENCVAYAFPSLSEGFGLPPLEAMIHGAPVAASNATCIPEVCGDAAHYFEPTNVGDIARAISDLIDNPAVRQSLIIKGRAQAAQYSWQRMADQTLDVYNRALKNNTAD